MTLYKYKSISEYKYFMDMLLNNRLYAAPYFKLNDPMEGQYLYSTGHLSRDMIRAIKGEKVKLGICSLSRKSDNTVMWTHYADSHKGIVVGVDIDRTHYDIREVQYTGLRHVVNTVMQNLADTETAKNILSHKTESWSYEDEERVFVTDSSSYVNVAIINITLGSRMPDSDKELVRETVARINDNIVINESLVALI